MRWARSTAILVAAMSGALSGCGGDRDAPQAEPRFELQDIATVTDAWAKLLADVSGDGRADLVVAERGKKRVVAYIAPEWTPRELASGLVTTTGLAAGDLNGDGSTDIVVATDASVIMLTAPAFRAQAIAQGNMHDVRVADMNGDGRLDVVARNQTAFRKQPAALHVFLQSDGGWRDEPIEVADGEGLAIADLDRDGALDIIVNAVWYRNRGSEGDALRWDRHRYAAQWEWPHTMVATADIDGDARLDIVMTPAELEGQRYRISWFSQPEDATAPWRETIVEPDVEATQHSLALADFDGDGAPDILRAQMDKGSGGVPVAIHFNPRGAGKWAVQTLSSDGSHGTQAGDLDGDGDIDFIGANYAGKSALQLWRNDACDGPAAARVKRHVVGENLSGKNLFVRHADLDGDGRLDLLAGNAWYRNPGVLGARWDTHSFGDPVGNVVLVHDFDRDGAPDVLYSSWRGHGSDPALGIAWNAGGGEFSVAPTLPGTAGDFLQGAVVIDQDATQSNVALSWHGGAHGIETMRVSVARDATPVREWIASVSQEEALSAADLDGDGDTDLLLGTKWLERTPTDWRVHEMRAGEGKPDRNVLVDMNGDGRLDAVVGFEAISRPGKLIWLENAGNGAWPEHSIGEPVGPMSVGVVDADRDGRPDVFVGEHQLNDPASARLWYFRNGGNDRWSAHAMWTGDEHHDGLVATDLDRDGDVDIASVGWSHGRVHVYESLASACVQAVQE